ncbi:hypothetical protein D9M71_612470 [compost metagenome]
MQHTGERHHLVVAIAHVGEQGAEVRLIHTQLTLHLGVGQADLAADHAPTVCDAMGDIEPLDGVGGLGVVFTNLFTQRFDRFTTCLGLAQGAGQLIQSLLGNTHDSPQRLRVVQAPPDTLPRGYRACLALEWEEPKSASTRCPISGSGNPAPCG